MEGACRRLGVSGTAEVGWGWLLQESGRRWLLLENGDAGCGERLELREGVAAGDRGARVLQEIGDVGRGCKRLGWGLAAGNWEGVKGLRCERGKGVAVVGGGLSLPLFKPYHMISSIHRLLQQPHLSHHQAATLSWHSSLLFPVPSPTSRTYNFIPKHFDNCRGSRLNLCYI